MLIIFSRVSICHSSHLLLHSILISWLLPRWTNTNFSCNHSYSVFHTFFFIVPVFIVFHSSGNIAIFLKQLQFAWKIVSVKPNTIIMDKSSKVTTHSLVWIKKTLFDLKTVKMQKAQVSLVRYVFNTFSYIYFSNKPPFLVRVQEVGTKANIDCH